jgi:hypothetical protein
MAQPAAWSGGVEAGDTVGLPPRSVYVYVFDSVGG